MVSWQSCRSTTSHRSESLRLRPPRAGKDLIPALPPILPRARGPEPAASILRKIPLLLPGMHMRDVLLPLTTLGPQVVLQDVIAEGALHHLVLLHLVEGLREVGGKLADAQTPLLAVAHGEDV